MPRSDGARAFSKHLTERVREMIDRSGGAVDFSEFMQCVLYEPGLGYYVAGHRKFGPEGDFVTAPELGDLFGRCLGRQCAEILKYLSGGDILEFGAGTGLLCTQILKALRDCDSLPDHYYILELSPELQDRQRSSVSHICPDLLPRCRWLSSLPDNFKGVAIANEVLDAMPVIRFRVAVSGLEIIQVSWSGGAFRETARPVRDGELTDIADKKLPVGYESEAGVLSRQWVAEIGNWLEQGVVLIVDYGFPAREFYHPDRRQGTLMCHYRHRAHTDPYAHVGMQDITAHLDFSALAHAAAGHGLDVLGFTHQAAFLLSLGLLDFVQRDVETFGGDQWALSQQVQRLTQSHEMGELFKVLALGKRYPGALSGFEYLDHRARL